MKPVKALHIARIAVEAAAFALATGLFTSVGMAFPAFALWIADIQLFPAAMAFGMGVFVAWLIVTLLLGRIYCSTVCPMGALQDIFARLRRHGLKALRRKPRRYRYAPASPRLRYGILAIVVACLLSGFSIVASLLDPYSAFGRIALSIFRPVWTAISSPGVVAAGGSLLGIIVAAATMIAVAWVAWRNGRTICNTICPVGSTLGLVSRYSIFHIDINTDLCIQCGRCEAACKSHCINLTDHTVDSSRCVVCFDCLPVCPNDAISYTPSSHRLQLPMMMKVQTPAAARQTLEGGDASRLMDRRKFLAAGIVAALTPLALKADKAIEKAAGAAGARRPEPMLAVTPPGAADRASFLAQCTACGLCVSHCPTGVLRPAGKEYGSVRGLLHPVMHYDDAACDFSCTRCNNLCPTGALTPLTLREKQRTVIGRAIPIHSNCIHCGACARACPRRAIAMTGNADYPVPEVNPALCIGCGACQSVCPAYPYKAIYVDGI